VNESGEQKNYRSSSRCWKSTPKPRGEMTVLSDSTCACRATVISLVGIGLRQIDAVPVAPGMDHLARHRQVSGEWSSGRTTGGIVFQNYSLFPHLTVLENVIFGLELERSLPGEVVALPALPQAAQAVRREGREFLARFRLEEHACKYARAVGGMRQRWPSRRRSSWSPSCCSSTSPSRLDEISAASASVPGRCILRLEEDDHRLRHAQIYEAVLLADRVLVSHPSTARSRARGAGAASSTMPRSRRPAAPAQLESTRELTEMVREIRELGLDLRSSST